MKRFIFTVALVFGAALAALHAEIQWRGLTITEGEPVFLLVSSVDQTSKWVSLGQSFAGSKVTAFDPLQEIVTIAQGDDLQKIRLQNASVRDSSAEDARARLRSLTGMELAYEVAKQGDVNVTETLKAYQSVLARLTEIRVAAAGSDNPQTATAIKWLAAQVEELQSQAKKAAASKAAFLLSQPAKP